jgi:dynein heavy chain
LKAVFDDKRFPNIEGNKEIMTKHILFSDVLGDGISTSDRKIDEITPSQKSILTERMNGYLEDFNSVSKKPMNLVLFDFAIMHVLRVCRVLRMASGNVFLIGVGGSGR